MGSIDQLPANHLDKTISNVVVEDVDSKIIMANVVPNTNRSSTNTLVTNGGNIHRRNGNTLKALDDQLKGNLKSNASIINVDNDCYELVPSGCFPTLGQSGYLEDIEEVKENIYSSENNICKLFVKEGTPPKVRKKEIMVTTYSEVQPMTSSTNMNEKIKDGDVKVLENTTEAREHTTVYNDTFQTYTTFPIVQSLSQSNEECHKTEFKIEDHHFDVLQGLNQLRNEGSFLDVTLWAENQPFQVRQLFYPSPKN